MENLEETVKFYDEIAVSLSPDSIEYQKLIELKQDYIALKKDNDKKEQKIAILGPKAIEDGLTKPITTVILKNSLKKKLKNQMKIMFQFLLLHLILINLNILMIHTVIL